MIRLAVRVRRDQADLVLAELLELAPGGVEEVDIDADVVEYAVYGAPGELPALPDLEASAGGALVEVVTTEIADDWSQRWREFHRPVVIGDRLTVRPPWEPASSNSIDLVIDPGQAFGTGAHATTRLCLEMLLSLSQARGAFVDLGCGSGVLAIAAARLGYEPVLALDNDPASVQAAADNAAANGVELEVRGFDLRSEDVPAAGTVTANLLGPLLRGWAPRLAASPQHVPARLIASGLLVAEADGIAEAFVAAGLREADRRESGEWGALLLERA
ncbi:MAG: 50S ribosomal protein L11 methyltransferase [Solirubrobacteraceae bacterium]